MKKPITITKTRARIWEKPNFVVYEGGVIKYEPLEEEVIEEAEVVE